MYRYRTDLAVEAHMLAGGGPDAGALPGVQFRESTRQGFAVTVVDVLDEQGEKALCKPMGRYVTLELDELIRREDEAFSRGAQALAEELTALLPLQPGQSALVVGLGNRAVTPDAVGPKTVGYTMATRHLVRQEPEQFGVLRPVAACAPGVLGMTGLESGDIIAALVEKFRPDCVLAVDALASRDTDRVCRTVQLSDTGIVPGSGVGNARQALNRETLGVPVVAVGVPTVVDAVTLAYDVLEQSGIRDLELDGAFQSMMVTPREIDQRVEDVSRLMGYGINLALHPGITMEDINLFVG